MAAGAHSFFDFRRWVVEPSGDTDVFSGDPLLAYDPIYNCTPDEKAKAAADFDV